MEVDEGGVTVEVPEQADEGTGGAVFFNPVQELNRDVTVATLRAYRERSPDDVATYLDATAASGIRGVRASAAGFEATCCDVDPDAVALAERNFARNDLDGSAVRRDANALMHESWFDVVDVDPFGTPVPFVDAACNSARHLLCVTATDTAPLCGAHFESGVRSYGAVPLNTEFHAEMGLRVLLSAIVRTAARYDVAARPVLSHVSNHYIRTYLEVERGARVADDCIEELGYLYWCPNCLYREHERGLVADPPGPCPHCGAGTRPSGPLWLGRAHDPAFVRAVRDSVDDGMNTARRARRLLGRIADELVTPTHYDTHRLFETWSESVVGMDEILERLRSSGFEASRTHFGGTTVKTTADVPEMTDLFAPDL